VKTLGFLGEIFLTQMWLTRPDPSYKKMTQPRSKIFDLDPSSHIADYYNLDCNLIWDLKIAWLGIKPTTLDLESQSGAFDFSDTTGPCPCTMYVELSPGEEI